MNNHRFIQREISWNAFNARVLDEGCRKDRPLLDRLKFMAITSSNYDEFFMVRVARLMRDSRAGDAPQAPEGQRPSEILQRLLSEIQEIAARQDHEMTGEILPGLAGEGLTILPPEKWDSMEFMKADRVFEHELFSLCTPVALNPGKKIESIIAQGQIHAAFMLDGEDVAVIRLPDNLKRFRDVRLESGNRIMVLLEDILLARGDRFFPGRKVRSSCLFRLTRDADMGVDEERDENFIEAMEEILERREGSFPVRLEIRGAKEPAEYLQDFLALPEENIFHLKAPLKLRDFFRLAFLSGYDHLRSSLPGPRIPQDLDDDENLWEAMKDRDILLHHPYESYTPVIRMVEEAADDPATLAIKMTLYRTSGESPIVEALIRAAERGVQVTALVELKARFDEGANIGWATRLEKAGAIVIYGLVVLKVHAKMLMVVRREDDGIHRYVHLATGNYNDFTAKLYTDMGLMTSQEDYTREAALVFNAITGYSSEPQLATLAMAPFSLRRETLRLIRREEKRARSGEEARITAKMNSLVDPEIIEALYRASAEGVRIDLNVRGICCLRSGVKGLSENIRVVSIIDSFLEHTRAFMYYNGGRPEVYLSSADWMTRNLDRRVELMFPITSDQHKKRIIIGLERYFRDNRQAWTLGPDDHWTRVKPSHGEREYRAQMEFAGYVAAKADNREIEEKKALKVRRKPAGKK